MADSPLTGEKFFEQPPGQRRLFGNSSDTTGQSFDWCFYIVFEKGLL